jgi:hypothetical protein
MLRFFFSNQFLILRLRRASTIVTIKIKNIFSYKKEITVLLYHIHMTTTNLKFSLLYVIVLLYTLFSKKL